MNKLLSLTVAMTTFVAAECAYKDVAGLDDLSAANLASTTTGSTNVETTKLAGYWIMTHSTYLREDRVGCIDLHLSNISDDGYVFGSLYTKELWSWILPTYYSG